MYKLYLGLDTGEGFNIPVLPEKLEISEDGNNKTYDIINLGEINILNKPKLRGISFESYFPKNNGPYVSSEHLFEPSFYVAKIQEWRDNLKPIRLILVGSPLEINDLYAIESFKYRESGGEVGDIYYSIEFKKYLPYSAKKVVVVEKKNSNSSKMVVVNKAIPRPTTSKPKPKTHIVKKGDILWGIAKKYLGNGGRWREIYNLNKDKIKNPNLIYTGQVFKLP